MADTSSVDTKLSQKHVLSQKSLHVCGLLYVLGSTWTLLFSLTCKAENTKNGDTEKHLYLGSYTHEPIYV